MMAGRGFGKTRSGAEWVRDRVNRGIMKSGLLIGKNPRDVRDYMLYGESGLLSIGPPEERPKYEPSKLLLTWPNGAQAIVRSGEDKDVRGPNLDTIWADELAAWQYPAETFGIAMLALRSVRTPGGQTQCMVTTTPKPIVVLRELVNADYSVVTTGSTYENIQNLSDEFRRLILAKYEGTTLGQQELYAVLLEEAEGALWTRQMLTDTRAKAVPDELVRTVVGVDPAISKHAESAETGIIVASRGRNGDGYVRADVSGRCSPHQWAQRVVQAYDDFAADRVVIEDNQGGDMVEHVLRTVRPTLAIKRVHATDGKRTRAEPVAALYEQGRVHHVGVFPDLEDQMCTWVPDSGEPSPDRMDAAVWALTELLHTQRVPTVDPGGVEQRNYWRVA